MTQPQRAVRRRARVRTDFVRGSCSLFTGDDCTQIYLSCVMRVSAWVHVKLNPWRVVFGYVEGT